MNNNANHHPTNTLSQEASVYIASASVLVLVLKRSKKLSAEDKIKHAKLTQAALKEMGLWDGSDKDDPSKPVLPPSLRDDVIALMQAVTEEAGDRDTIASVAAAEQS